MQYIQSAFSAYWNLFGVDFSNPSFWLYAFLVAILAAAAGSYTTSRWGLWSRQFLFAYTLSVMMGVAVNIAF